MVDINVAEIETAMLLEYDRMMMEATVKLDEFPALAIAVWQEVRRELGRRNALWDPAGTGGA